MKEIDIIYPETIKIRLCGRDIEIKPLTIKQSIDLGRIINTIKTESDFAASAQASSLTDSVRMAKLLEMAGSNKSREILNILTGGALKDINNPQEKITLLELSHLIKALAEVNDFKTLFLNFTLALRAAAGQTRFQTP